MKYIKIIYNSFLWSLTAATLCFKNEWLQMRVNTGWIFLGLLFALSIILMLVFRKKKFFMNWILTACNLGICTLIGLFVYGFARMKVVPAALLREGINRTDISFSKINLCLLIITIVGFIVILISDLLKQKNK